MYGWRARVGLIVPSSNTTMELEMWRLMPEGVSIHTARIALEKVTVEELEAMGKGVEEASRLLSTIGPDIVIFGCTTGSLVKGPGYDEELARRIERTAGAPAVATATAVVEALKSLGAERIALATPYIDEVNEREVKFLEHHGFSVVDLRALRIRGNVEIGRVEPWRVYRLAKSLDYANADALFISCTNLRTLEVINALERDTGRPVVSSNTATAWATLRKLKVCEAGFRAGELLENIC